MPAKYFFDSESALVVVQFTGTMSGTDLQRIDAMVMADPEAMGRVFELSDLRLVTASTLTTLDLDASARRWSAHYESTSLKKFAMVAPQDLTFGQSRMYVAFAQERPYETRVFRDAEEAEAWFDIPSGSADRLISRDPRGNAAP